MVKPTIEQIEWSNCEVGVIIHYDIQVFEPGYEFREQWGYSPSPSIFNPSELDTDQWVRTAKEAGAKYAVLVAKHCTGFSLWPTAAHEFSIKNSPYKDGKGDIVGSFIESCKKYDMKPGLYYSTVCNAYFQVDNPGLVKPFDEEKQKAYNKIVEQQVTELWTQYGDLFEIWFDGGILKSDIGGANIVPLLKKYQPKAVCFQGPTEHASLLRWVGNELGHAPQTCWSTTNLESNFDGVTENDIIGEGDPEGTVWSPAESDMPNRKKQWFWREGDEELLYSTEELLDCYYHSVGRNTNLLLGMVIDDHGLVPEADIEIFKEFGTKIEALAQPIQETGALSKNSISMILEEDCNTLVISEDIGEGHRVRGYEVTLEIDGVSTCIEKGASIGHKRMIKLDGKAGNKVTIDFTNCVDEPLIRNISLHKVDWTNAI